MKIFVYGMQSSGASLFTCFLAQRPETIAVIDLWDGVVAPDFSDTEKDVIVKCVVAPVTPLEAHLASFKPDIKILFVRSKAGNIDSLSKKSYRDDGGKMEEKFAQLESHIEQPTGFDHVINYEDFLNDRPKVLATLGSLAAASYYEFKRTKNDILDFNRTHSEWCRKNYRKKWGFGNIHFEKDGTIQLSARKPKTKKKILERLYNKIVGS